jgi:hypothetical protein
MLEARPSTSYKNKIGQVVLGVLLLIGYSATARAELNLDTHLNCPDGGKSYNVLTNNCTMYANRGVLSNSSAVGIYECGNHVLNYTTTKNSDGNYSVTFYNYGQQCTTSILGINADGTPKILLPSETCPSQFCTGGPTKFYPPGQVIPPTSPSLCVKFTSNQGFGQTRYLQCLACCDGYNKSSQFKPLVGQCKASCSSFHTDMSQY